MVGSRRVAVGVCIIIVTASLVLGAGVAHGSSSTRVGDDSCSNEIVNDEQERVDARELTELFDAGLGATSGPQLVGMDYQRAFELDDGRVLWVFQDAFVADGDGTELIHAAGAIQTGTCFEPLVGSDRGAPESWIAPDETVPFERWFWPLDGYQVDDATFLLFVAEMRESGEAYLTRAAPAATHTVEVDHRVGEPLIEVARRLRRRRAERAEVVIGRQAAADDEDVLVSEWGQCPTE